MKFKKFLKKNKELKSLSDVGLLTKGIKLKHKKRISYSILKFLNFREKDKNSKLIIQMQDKITSIEDPDNSCNLKHIIFKVLLI